jgi:hypothetical protein
MIELIATEEPLPSATSPKGLLQVSDVWYWATTSCHPTETRLLTRCQVEQALSSRIHL